MKILIIDDDELVIGVMIDLLNAYHDDLYIDISMDKDSAYRIASEKKFDVIISDQNMCGYSGIDFLLAHENTGAKLFLFSADPIDLRNSSVVRIDKLSIKSFAKDLIKCL